MLEWLRRPITIPKRKPKGPNAAKPGAAGEPPSAAPSATAVTDAAPTPTGVREKSQGKPEVKAPVPDPVTTKDELAGLLFSEGRHADAGTVLTWTGLDRQALLEGKVELVIPATVELNLVSNLFDYLQTTADLKVLYTKGSWDGSATIAVVLEEALPLLDIISKMPGIEASAELSGDVPQPEGSQLPISDKSGTGARKVRLHLKAA